MKKKRVQEQVDNRQDELLASEHLDRPGLEMLVRAGIKAQEETKTKNRLLLGLVGCLFVALIAIALVGKGEPIVRVLAVTPDGRYKPLPALSDPLYSHQDILVWSERCVRDIYRLSYIDWRETIQNDTFCLSDKARESFAGSLRELGLLDKLTPENQGVLYATPDRAVMRASGLGPQGYQQWVVDVPYRITLDGNQKGHLDVVISMTVKRVSLALRETGIWVDSYRIAPQRR